MSFILEDLPNELFLLIFTYLTNIDIIYSFYRLNYRFTSLIRALDHIHIDFSTRLLSKTQLIYILNQLRSLNIHSIRISTRYSIDFIPFFVGYLPPSQFTHLRSLAFQDADRMTIEKLIHKYPHLTYLSIESSSWRSIPRHCFPYFPNLTRCHLPTLSYFHHCHPHLTNLRLDHCTTDDLLHLNTIAPNLHSLTLILQRTTTIPPAVHFPESLYTLKLILRSVLFTELERLVKMNEHIETLIVSFSNTEHEVHCFDQYLFGDHWSSLNTYFNNFRFNIIVHQTSEAFSIEDLLSNFHWYNERLHCQTLDDTNGYHLFSLPFIDELYRINCGAYDQNVFNNNDFHRVNHLHFTMTHYRTQEFLRISSKFAFQHVQILTIVASSVSSDLMSFVGMLMDNSPIRTLELRLTSSSSDSREFFNKLVSHMPITIEMLTLNMISTRFLFDLLDNNARLLSHVKRLSCLVKNRDEFDSLILLLLEVFHDKSLIYLSISLENPSKSSNLISGWLLKTSYLKKARIKCSDRQCIIWI
ncbi:unnamed protein product [Adineta ricciae]|uniref:F-box domain-containing protein n=1 Tax=Adineta ricciae TaxID=249248 RepID=A0A815UK42_ADIRI|nr:unnamed protein product [Adineta ricciae]